MYQIYIRSYVYEQTYKLLLTTSVSFRSMREVFARREIVYRIPELHLIEWDEGVAGSDGSGGLNEGWNLRQAYS